MALSFVPQTILKNTSEPLNTNIVMPDLETESTLELNFIIGKIKHTVKRIKKSSVKIESEEDGL